MTDNAGHPCVRGAGTLGGRMEDVALSEFLRYEPLLERIVRDIVGKDAVADVLQETWLAALRGPRPQQGSTGAWLARVARNFAYEHLRSEARRRDREATVRSEPSPPAADFVVQLLATREQALRVVEELDEPYREAVSLRYLGGMSYARIAAELGTSEATVRQRVKRGLDRLRQRMARREERDRGTGLALGSAVLSTRRQSALVPEAALRFVTAASVVAMTAVCLAILPEPVPGEDVRVVSVAVPRTDPAPDAPAEWSRDPIGAALRVGLAERRGEAATTRGRVLDRGGTPVQGVRVEIPGSVAVVTDASGSFVVEGEPGPDGLEIGAPYMAVYSSASAGAPWMHELEEHLILGARTVAVTGIVVDGTGRAVPDVRASAHLLPPVAFPMPLTTTVPCVLGSTVTDGGGAFSLTGIPEGCAEVVFEHPRFDPVRRGIDGPASGLQIVLERPAGEAVVRGRVVDVAGLALMGARVGAGDHVVRTRDDGTYELPLPNAGPSRPVSLFAASAGFATQVQAVSLARDGRADLDWTLAPSGRIAGRVLLDDGRPWQGALVVPWGEALVSGSLSATDLARSGVAPADYFGVPEKAFAVADARGEFSFDGFGPGVHRLAVVDPGLSLLHVSEPLSAGGHDVVIRVPPDARRDVEGRVTDVAGRPVPNVEIELALEVAENGPLSTWRTTARTARTDHAGSFRFRGVPRACRALLVINHPPELYEPVPLEGDAESVEIVMEPLRFFRVDLAGAGAGVARLLDADGDEVPIVQAHQSAWFRFQRSVPLMDGKSPVMATSGRVQTLILEGRPALSVPLRLDPVDVTTIRG